MRRFSNAVSRLWAERRYEPGWTPLKVNVPVREIGAVRDMPPDESVAREELGRVFGFGSAAVAGI